MSSFFRNWLAAWCWVVGVFGVVLIGGGLAATDGISVRLLEIIGGVPVEMTPPLRFAVALMGCVTLGWSLTMAAALRAAHVLGAGARPLWAGLTGSVLAWYVIDSSFSVATGFALNAVSNTLLLAGFLYPVLRSGVLSSARTAPPVRDGSTI